MDSGYWHNVSSKRLSRRRALALGAAASGAAFLVACGGSSDGSSASKGKKIGLLTSTTEEGTPKRGGVWNTFNVSDPINLDPYRQNTTPPQQAVGPTYNHLLRFGTGPKYKPGNFDAVPDLAESWEVSDGGLTYTFKLRKDVKFQNIAPVNGRAFDSGDVKFSWERLTKAPIFTSTFAGLVDATGLSTPDANTVVIKLKVPDSAFITLITQPQLLYVMPREASGGTGGFDPLNKAIGTGPWILSDHVISSRLEYKRNPDYFEKGIPYMDAINSFLIPEVAQQVAQFRAGNLQQMEPKPSDVPDLLQSLPDLRMYEGPRAVAYAGLGFGRGDPNSPALKDKRVRQALSMMIDREAVIETMADLPIWKGLGIERQATLDNILPVAFEHWWTDPRGKEMGDTATYFKFDVKEAKKLLAAAGFDKGFNIDFHYTPEFLSAQYRQTALIVSNMLKEGGININVVPDDYNAVWQPKTQVGESTGLLFSVAGQYYDPTPYLNYFYAPDGTRNHMKLSDPVYNDLMQKQRITLDANQRRSILLDVQKHMADEMRYSPVTFQLSPIMLAYPYAKNVNAYRSPASSYGVHLESTAYYWLDK